MRLADYYKEREVRLNTLSAYLRQRERDACDVAVVNKAGELELVTRSLEPRILQALKLVWMEQYYQAQAMKNHESKGQIQLAVMKAMRAKAAAGR